jgi:dimethylhistidine N-methyltransferase
MGVRMPFEVPSSAAITRLDDSYVPTSVKQSLKSLLSERPRKLHPSLSYDPEGSVLFEELCAQPEYYLTRTEVGLLRNEGAAVVHAAKPDTIIDLGCGNFEKTQILIHEAVRRAQSIAFYPCDIDEDIIAKSLPHLTHFYGGAVSSHGLVGSFERCLDYLHQGADRRLFIFIGSTYGNLSSEERASLLESLAKSMGERDSFLLGVDLVKSPSILEAAYNDEAGCIRKSMLRMLVNLNEQYGANFDLGKIDHVSRYMPAERKVVSYLISSEAQTVSIPGLDLDLQLDANEAIEAEIREKFVLHHLLQDLCQHGLTPVRVMADEARPYALILCRRTSAEEFGALSAAA